MNKQDYYKSLPRKRMGSGVIIQNKKGDILVLKTNYKDHWEIPGGVVEENESPKQTAERETLEEVGLEIKISKCLVIHYRSSQDGQDENTMFVFNGGISSLSDLKIDNNEISEARFISWQEAIPILGKRIASRLPFCQQALKENRTIYLESINMIDPTFSS